MANILEQLAEHAVYRTELAKRKLPPAEIKNQALSVGKGNFAFEKALRKPGISFICECKKASPSKGLIAPAVSVPCLRKDFTVDEYMIYEAKLLGASAVLLICSILSAGQIGEYLAVCDTLGLSALVETHDEAEVETALAAGARVIGVNNRNLKDFTVDTENSRRLRERIPRDVLFVSESGVSGPEDVKRLAEIGADAVLVGEALMRASNKKQMLLNLRKC